MLFRGAESENKGTKCCYFSSSYLVFGHCTDNKRAHHPRQRTHAVRNAHQDAGVAWSDVQMIDIKALRDFNGFIRAENKRKFRLE